MFLGKIHCRPLVNPSTTTTPLASLKTKTKTKTSASPAPLPIPIPNAHFHFHAADYLVHSCGLSFDQALKSSKQIHHLKTPHNPDAVLCFLRETGISQSDISAAVARAPRLLCSSVERNLRPNMEKLLEVGLSVDDISGFIARSPRAFMFNCTSKIDFWLGVLGSVGNLKVVLRRCNSILHMNLERVIMPNLSFLQSECGLSARQIAQLIVLCPRLITSSPETMKMKAKRADDLGSALSSGMCLYALCTVDMLSQRTLDARLNNLESALGFSQEEVNLLVRKFPQLLRTPAELVSRKMEFLIKEAGCDKVDVIRKPTLLIYSLEKRIIPRNIVRKLLMSKSLPVANLKFASFVAPTEKKFLEKFVLPYEHAIPGLRQAYSDACAGNIGRRRLNGLKSVSS